MKKPPTRSKGIISTGTKAITMLASANTVERKSPKEELINANNYNAKSDQKNAPAELSRLEGK
jgi:hypothetical protein